MTSGVKSIASLLQDVQECWLLSSQLLGILSPGVQLDPDKGEEETGSLIRRRKERPRNLQHDSVGFGGGGDPNWSHLLLFSQCGEICALLFAEHKGWPFCTFNPDFRYQVINLVSPYWRCVYILSGISTLLTTSVHNQFFCGSFHQPLLARYVITKTFRGRVVFWIMILGKLTLRSKVQIMAQESLMVSVPFHGIRIPGCSTEALGVSGRDKSLISTSNRNPSESGTFIRYWISYVGEACRANSLQEWLKGFWLSWS